MSRQVRIASATLAASFSSLGAELQSVTDAAGREYMTNADPAYWTGHAPLLFPIVGRLNGDVLRVNGREYPMKQHGFARKAEWEIIDAGEDAVTFRLGDSEETRAAYPFAFSIVAHYRLEDARLSSLIIIANQGDALLPFSFGFHPAFAWPLPSGGDKLAHRIMFEADEPAAIRRLNADGLLEFNEATPVKGKELSLSPALFEADAMIWDTLASRKLTYAGGAGHPRLALAFSGMPHLGIWQKPGADFICIEPWQGHADPAGFVGEFAQKPGIVLLAPGAERSFRMDVTVNPA